MQNVAKYLLTSKNPEQIALSFPQSSYSYGSLTVHAGQLAAYLHSLGVPKGTRVLLVGDNSHFWVTSYLGILQAGLVCVPVAANSKPLDLQYILDSTGADIICMQTSIAAIFSTSLIGKHLITDKDISPIPEALSLRSLPRIIAELEPREDYELPGPKDLAALVFTSGSTGHPRGVMISHSNIIANTDSIISYLELTKLDRIMAVLPFHYCYGASLLHTHLRVGGEIVIDNRFMYPEVVLQRMIETHCTGFAGVPSHFQILLRKSTIWKKQFPDLRYVQQAGGCLAPSFIREMKEALPNTKIYIMYGQTEATARLSYLPPDNLEAKLGSIGKGVPGVTLRVLNEQGIDVRVGEVGEIVAEGANVALGYWQAPAETDSVFRNGALYTGDLARIDEDGFIYIVDRAKEFLKCRGEKVSCRQLEGILLECKEVVEAAVIGIPDEVFGEAVKAFVVPRSKDSIGLEESITTFCKSLLPPHLLPKHVVILPGLPKNASGKVMKSVLRAS